MTPAEEVLALLKVASERDLQQTVGPSSLGTPCTYCLAVQMMHGERGLNRYWLGARIGTAIHHELEQLVIEHRPETKPETRVVVGEVPGYGVIKGTADWSVPGRVRDFKTTTRDKSIWLKRAHEEPPDDLEVSKITDARFKLASYWNQTHLYAKGIEDAGEKVEWIDIIFINRDGKEDRDVWSISREYDRSIAEAVLARAARLWEYLQDGGDIESLNSARGCYTCSVERRV